MIDRSSEYQIKNLSNLKCYLYNTGSYELPNICLLKLMNDQNKGWNGLEPEMVLFTGRHLRKLEEPKAIGAITLITNKEEKRDKKLRNNLH